MLGLFQLGWEAAAHKNSSPAQSDFDRRSYKILLRETDEDALIAANISEQVSAMIERRSLRLPSDPMELLEINRTYLPVDYVLLSKDLVRGNLSDQDEPGYHETYDGYVSFVTTPEFLEIYAYEEQLPNGAVLYVRRELVRK